MNEYYLLAGSLIKQGLVDANACQHGGLESNGAANVCGMELARPMSTNGRIALTRKSYRLPTTPAYRRS